VGLWISGGAWVVVALAVGVVLFYVEELYVALKAARESRQAETQRLLAEAQMIQRATPHNGAAVTHG
jgi:hypothetical protein